LKLEAVLQTGMLPGDSSEIRNFVGVWFLLHREFLALRGFGRSVNWYVIHRRNFVYQFAKEQKRGTRLVPLFFVVVLAWVKARLYV
jgi:hypothetical protein